MKMQRKTTWKGLNYALILILVCLACFFLPVEGANAATLIVTNTNNSGSGSLRQAVADAGTGDTIEFHSSLSGGTITLLSHIIIDKDLTIDGSTLASPINLSGGNSVRIFYITGAITVNLESLHVRDGDESSGGGIFVDGTSTLDVLDCAFENNYGVLGGAIYNQGTLSVSSSSFTTNSSLDGGAITNFGGTATLTSVDFLDNSATSGGAIQNWGTMDIDDADFSLNSADDGGAIYNQSGTLTITFGSFTDNTATDDGAGIFNDHSLIISDTTFETNTAGMNGGGIHNTGIFAQVTDCDFTENNATFGAGLSTEYSLDVFSSSFTNNSAANGAGITLIADDLDVEDTTFSGNTAGNFGGGIYIMGGNLNLHRNTFDGNHGYQGGAIYNADHIYSSNNTYYGNTADQHGGGIFNAGTSTLKASTFSENGASVSGAGVYNRDIGILDLTNSIIANSTTGGDCVNLGDMNHLWNLIEDGSCSPAYSGDPALGPFDYHGGPTQTFSLQAGSPAIDVYLACYESTDQRGVVRPQGVHCDLGAYEKAALSEVNSTGDMGDGVCDGTECTLREAVTVAASGDTITFDPALAGGTITLGATINFDKDLIIDGAGLDPMVQVSGGGTVMIFDVYKNLDVDFSRLKMINGQGGTAGALHTFAGTHVTLDECVIQGHSAFTSGAIFNAGQLDISSSTILENEADHVGGAIFNAGRMTITTSTLYDNQAPTNGGAVHNTGILTLSGNTFSNNYAGTNGADLHNLGSVQIKLYNNILANSSSGGNCYNGGAIEVNAGNLIEDGSCSPAVSGDPLLGTLGDNGGPTRTMALQEGSPAIDAGDDGLCEDEDQRGVSRPQGEHCDIGAYERSVTFYDGVGFYVPSKYRWYLKTDWVDGWSGVISFGWGGSSELMPVTGDWDGDGVETAAFYKPSQWKWFLKNDFNKGWPGVTSFQWGGAADLTPIAGDWDGDGDATVGFYNPDTGEWFLKDENTPGWTGFTKVIWGGAAENIPLVGDWNGDGSDTIGYYVPSAKRWWLKNDLVDGWGAVTGFTFGTADPMEPVTGDWDGDGVDTVGGYTAAKWRWFLKDDQVSGWSNVFNLKFGPTVPYQVLAGDWQ